MLITYYSDSDEQEIIPISRVLNQCVLIDSNSDRYTGKGKCAICMSPEIAHFWCANLAHLCAKLAHFCCFSTHANSTLADQHI